MLVGYARVSTADQEARLQLDALDAAGCTRTFCDQASGKNRERPELARALDQLRAGDVLVVWKLDRLGRSLADLIALADQVAKIGADLQSLTERIDTASPGGRLFYHLLAAFSEFERDLIRERTLEGLKAARASGARPGRKPGLSADQVKAAAAILGEPANGLTVVAVAQLLGVSPATLYRHLPGGRSGVQSAAG